MQQTQSPLLRLWQLGRDHHGGLIAAIFCAVAGVLLGLLPYLSAGHMLVALLTGQRDWNFYFLWCMVALGGYLAKTLLYNLALSLSHKATFQILRDIRKMEVPVPLPGEKRYQDTPCREIRQQTQQDTRHRAEDGGNQAAVMIPAQLPQPQQRALRSLHK